MEWENNYHVSRLHPNPFCLVAQTPGHNSATVWGALPLSQQQNASLLPDSLSLSPCPSFLSLSLCLSVFSFYLSMFLFLCLSSHTNAIKRMKPDGRLNCGSSSRLSILLSFLSFVLSFFLSLFSFYRSKFLFLSMFPSKILSGWWSCDLNCDLKLDVPFWICGIPGSKSSRWYLGHSGGISRWVTERVRDRRGAGAPGVPIQVDTWRLSHFKACIH